MRLSLEKIRIENFKGIRELSIDFGAEQTAIAARNGCGKSSIADAFTWVLFNKDSHGNAPGSDNFREKPLDENGAEVHNLETVVELDCTLDGQRFSLKRAQKENWVKKRGSTNPEFKGNESRYWINDVETKLSDFKARISQIVPEEIFRLIGTLAAFNAQDWKKRREQLLNLTGGEVDGRLLAMDEYRPLADECGQRNISIDELKKVLMDQRKKMNAEINGIPIRIDEARKALPEFAKDEIDTAEYIIKENTKDIEHIDELIAVEKAKVNRESHASQIAALEQEEASLMRQASSDWAAGHRELQRRRDEASEDFRKTIEQKTSDERRYELMKKQHETAKSELNRLRGQYKTTKDEMFVWADEGKNVCPTCGQEIPAELLEKKKAVASEVYAQEKTIKLNALKENGKAKAEEVALIEANMQKVEAEIEEANTKLKKAEEARDKVSEELKVYPTEPKFDNPRIEEIRTEIAKMRELDARVAPLDTKGYEERKAYLTNQITEKRAVLARRDAGKETEKRIAELEAEQKKLGGRMAELEQLIALTEKFVTERCSALEESINEKFPTVRWKLFDTQINGGIVDVCEAKVNCDGHYVPYSTANTAAQVHADIEIVDVLSKAYDVRIPLFVDNAERCNHIPKIDSQIITMAVSTDENITIKEVA